MNEDAKKEGYVRRPEDMEEVSASTVLLVKGIGDRLEAHYPGWLWAIQPNEKGGILSIRALRLSGEWGYVFRLREIQDDPTHAKAIRAGGEILERFGVPRGVYRYEDWKQTPKDLAGVARADVSDKPLKVRRYQRDLALTNAVRAGRVKIEYQDRVGRGVTRRELKITGA